MKPKSLIEIDETMIDQNCLIKKKDASNIERWELKYGIETQKIFLSEWKLQIVNWIEKKTHSSWFVLWKK